MDSAELDLKSRCFWHQWETHPHVRLGEGGDWCPLPPILPLTCTLEPVHGVRGPCPQKASEVSLGRKPRLDLPLALALWLASKVEVRSPGTVLLPLWGHQSETVQQLSPETPTDAGWLAQSSSAIQRLPGGARRHQEQIPWLINTILRSGEQSPERSLKIYSQRGRRNDKSQTPS